MVKIFGEISTFAIQFVPDNESEAFAHLHLILGGQLIGNPQESAMISSWRHSIEFYRDKLVWDFDKLKHKEFNNRSNEEIFELIFKSNQLEEEFKPQYKYLPVLENTIWQDCHISIDETTDAWQIAMIQEDEILKIMWKGWRQPCPKSKLNKHYSIVVERDFVINSINECLLYLDEKPRS